MLRELIATLKAVGKSTEHHQTDDGTQLLILPYGGRILGVFAPGSEENFLWTNSALNSLESARTYYASDDWQNSGGDRTWLAPEVDFFFPKFPNVDIAGYWQPRSLDPGNYELTKTNHGVKLTNRLNIEGFRSKKRVELEITKSVAAAPNPLRYDAAIRIDAIEYAGHTLLTSLKILDPDPNDAPLVGLWSLTQMPHQGNYLFQLIPEPSQEFTLVWLTRLLTNSRPAIVWSASRCGQPANTKSECPRRLPPAASATSIQLATSMHSSLEFLR